MIRAQNVLIERRDELPFPLPEGTRIQHGSFIHPNASVDTNAVIEQSVVAQDAVVGANAMLKHCVLMKGACVEEGAHLDHCILSPGAIVSANVSAKDTILADQERLENA